MKKLLKISALALAMSAILFSCANPNNSSTTTPVAPDNKGPNIPAGGKDNANDVFHGKSWTVKNLANTGSTPVKYVFAEDGTFEVFENDNSQSKGEYKVDDKILYTTTVKIRFGENKELKTRDEVFQINLAEYKNNTEMWNTLITQYGSEKMAEEYVRQSLDMFFPSVKYEYKLENGKYKMQMIAPEITTMPWEFGKLFQYFTVTPATFLTKYAPDMKGDFSENKIPLIVLENDQPTSNKKTATWSKKGEGNKQEITFTISDTEKYIFSVKPQDSKEWTEIK